MNWDDYEDADAMYEARGLTQPKVSVPPLKLPEKKKEVEEVEEMRMIAQMIGGDGSITISEELKETKLVDIAAFAKYGDDVCAYIHNNSTKTSNKNLIAFYKSIISDAGKYLNLEELQQVSMALDVMRNKKIADSKIKQKKKPNAPKIHLDSKYEQVDVDEDDY